jgi:acyl-ACP thioesterase
MYLDSDFPANAHFLDERYMVRSYESGVANHVSLATLCNYMQESAGLSADRMGWGIHKLQDEGLTWMLSRLYVKVSRYVPWGTELALRTWPSGMKGRLLATRCFQAVDGSGNEVFQAHSEWLYVDMKSQKIVKLPDGFVGLVPEGTPCVESNDLGGKSVKLQEVSASSEVRVRQSDLDFNDHVNNVHYVEWMLESLPGRCGPSEIDIVFRSAAKAGDVLVSECFCDGNRSQHQIRRVSDGAVLATAAMVWGDEITE